MKAFLDAIHPHNEAKYSPNLHRFMSARRNENIRRHGRVYKAPDGTLWLGVVDGPYLIGARLIGVLCEGAKTKVFAHPLPDGLVEVPDFWQTYIAVGRCAIDPGHERFFIGDESRWRVVGNTRECLWCKGFRQRRESCIDTITKERWVSIEDSVTQ